MQTAPKLVSPASDELHETMVALFTLGYWLLPLGDSESGKAPTAGFKNRKRLPLDVVKSIMERRGSTMYAIRCAGLVVVDLDRDNQATREFCEQRFGLSPYMVKTRRGEHHFFRSGDKPPGSIKTDEIEIDIKHGQNMFVVGPGSVRPDTGDQYRMGMPLPPVDELPVFRDQAKEITQVRVNTPAPDVVSLPSRAAPTEVRVTLTGTPEGPTVVDIDGHGIPVGYRNRVLCKKAVAFAITTANLETLTAELTAYAHAAFETMDGFDDAEVHKIARWGWSLRVGGDLKAANRDRDSEELMAFAAVKFGGDGYLLLQHLRHCHAVNIARPFAICCRSMARAASLPTWTEWRYRKAVEAIEATGRIVLVERGGNGKGNPHLYRLVNPATLTDE